MHDRLSRDALVAAYHASGKPRARWRVGAEFERHLLGPDGAPLPYDGVPGVRWLLERFAAEGPGAWTPYAEGDKPIMLVGHGKWDGANVTLEPGGQFELSGAPWGTARQVIDEAAAFAREVDAHLAGTGYRQVALGFTPFAAIDRIGWVPKGRYTVMREHLRATGPLSHHMMKGTCAVQATFDYADEADCARKVGLATRLGPLTTATFANSPYAEGRRTGFASWRGHIWTRTDPLRTGFPAAAEAFTFERWVDWLLDVPMMFHKDADGRWQPAHGRTFRAWMEADAATDPAGHPPGDADWELHLTSVFPEVRTKRTIEVRGADCVPLALAGGFTALWRGLLYDDDALAAATELADRFTAHGTQPDRFAVACKDGLTGTIGGRRLADWAAEAVELAVGGIARIERADGTPPDASDLEPLRTLTAQVASGRSPAHDLVDRLGDAPTPAAIAEATPMVS